MKNICSGWSEIAKYIGTSVTTAQRYERTLELPVLRHGKGPKAHVYAVRSELNRWLRRTGRDEAGRDEDAADEALQAQVISRIRNLTDLTLYRRDYRMLFDLKPYNRGVRVDINVEFELLNASDEDQQFTQEITVDDADHGRVKEMAVFKNGAPVYILSNPAAVGRASGYSIYRGNKLVIEPAGGNFLYLCRSSWVIHRADEDIWYNHMALPTLGVRIETHAPTNYTITPTFETSRLVLKGEHLDIAWSRRK